MALFHYLHVRAFVHETEDPAKVQKALAAVAQGAHFEVEETRAEGANGNTIVILEGQLRSGPAERGLFPALARDDPGGLASLVAQLPRRIDENLNVYFRLDKQEACGGRLRLTASDDAITVRGKLRAFTKADAGAEAAAVQSLQAFLTGLRIS